MIFKQKLSQENWATKYQYGEETPLQTFIRVSYAIARVEGDKYGASKKEVQQWADRFLKVLVQFEPCEDDDYDGDDLYVDPEGKRWIASGLKSTPGGRITSNAGTAFDKATLLNCFINSPSNGGKIQQAKAVPNTDVEINCDLESEQTPDNLTNIFLSLLEAAETLKSEGGYGINFGFIRPRGTLIEGVGIRHPGVVSYMHVWDTMSEMIVKGDNDGYEDTITNHLSQDTVDRIEKTMPRKGAMMGVLPVWHPDIEEFVRAKQEDGVLTKFNISVLVDNAFMEAVVHDEMYDLHFNGKTYKRVKARELYDLIMECTYNRNEPGVLFFDNMNLNNPILYLGPITASNPCVAEGTLVATEDGLVPVEDVEVGDNIQTSLGFDPVQEIEVHEDYPVYRVEFSDGTSLRVTEGHIFHIWDRDKQEWDKDTRLMDLSQRELDKGVLVRKESYKFDGAEFFASGRVRIESIERDGTATVYDLYEPKSDDWNTHGIVSRGCGEIGGTSYLDRYYEPADYLKPYLKDVSDHLVGFTTVCLLGSINVTQYVKEDRTFDYEQYRKDVSTFARFLENVNDIGQVPLPAYQWALENIRQYGMGLNGLASAHFMLGLRYGSEESIEFIEKVQHIKDDETMRTSALLAKERGPFPMYDERYLETPYFKEFCTATEETKELVRQYGLRNAKRLTNPPLGNSSVICNMVSNGIDPAFDLSYNRTYIVDQWPEGLNRDNVKDILEEQQFGDSTAWRGEYNGDVYHYEPHNRGLCRVEPVEDYGYSWVKEHFPDDIENEAEYLVTAQDLTTSDHVRVQAAVQAAVDQSVSKTINLTEDYPFGDFKDLYVEAWKSGLVGVTTYRAGTMENVLESEDDSNKRYKTLLELYRDKDLTANGAETTDEGVIVSDLNMPDFYYNGPTKKVKREGNKYYMHFSYLTEHCDHPVALWIHSNDYEEGEYVTLNRAFRAVRDLLTEKGVNPPLVMDQVEKIYEDAYHVKLGKIISMALRHNIALPEIVAAISDIEGDYVATTLAAVRKFLIEQIEDGTKAKGLQCPACSSEQVVFESSCSICKDCGHSGCG